MAYQSVFKRYEIKFLLSAAQYELVLAAVEQHMTPDRYGRTTICNVYYDTENYRMIRRSVEKPVYKEKLRLRSYGPVTDGSAVFVELKKKYNAVVYKRRLSAPEDAAKQWLSGGAAPEDSQIAREIGYVRDHYGDLQPRMYISYTRRAYFGKEDPSLRITFDTDIRCRQEQLTLASQPGGTAVLDPALVLMEVKTPGAIPLWLTPTLTKHRIYKVSFSKYGTAYEKLLKGELRHV